MIKTQIIVEISLDKNLGREFVAECVKHAINRELPDAFKAVGVEMKEADAWVHRSWTMDS